MPTLAGPDTPPPVSADPARPVIAPPTALTPPAGPARASWPAATPEAPIPDIVAGRVAAAPPTLVSANPSWSGLYVGLNFGGGSSNGGTGESCMNTASHTSTGCQVISNSALSARGVLGGAQIGYMRPLDLNVGLNFPLMVGIEGDVQGSDISGSQNVAGPFSIVGFPNNTCSPCSFTASQKIGWFGTLRARIGVPVDNFLIYATGGLWVGGVSSLTAHEDFEQHFWL